MLTRLELTPANRPQLLQDEDLLFVQNEVGLYEGKNKIANYQNGITYLTTHRACYVDNAEPRKYSVAVELKDVDKVEPYAGFLKSSPKITLHLKSITTTPGSPPSTTPDSSTPRSSTPRIRESTPPVPLGVWICSICSFSNQIPDNYFPGSSAIPPCQSCGIKPSASHLDSNLQQVAPPAPKTKETTSCPRCTFHNHPSLPFCEMCATPLHTVSPPPTTPVLFPSVQIIKFSFRAGGYTAFLTNLRGALVQRKWLLRTAPPIPRAPSPPLPSMTPGIASLEHTSSHRRQKNAASISGAFSDLESLMSQAKEMVRLAQSLSRVNNSNSATSTPSEIALRKSTEALALVGKSQTQSQSAWIDELARQIAEFLVAGEVLRREGGVITLVDLWAIFNRARAGIDLVSPKDLELAIGRFDSLKLPVRERCFGTGIRVVQERGLGDEEVGRKVCDWIGWERGVTAREAAEHWGWSLGVANEELEMVEGRGKLCREVGVGGVKWWRNRFLEAGWESPQAGEVI